MAGIKFDIIGDSSSFKKAVNEAAAGVNDAKTRIESDGQSMGAVFDNLKGKVGMIFTAAAATELVTRVAQVRGEFQQLEVAFTTMLGSADKSSALMAQLTQTAAITPFGLQEVASGAKQLLAYGTSAEKVNETLIRLGDIAAGLSIPLGDLVYLYGTTQTQGRLFTQDMRQFMGRGIPIVDELAKQFGVTKDEVGALVTAGKVGFPEVEKAIISMTSEGGKFGGLMEAQSKTITGQISNLEDAIDMMFNEIGQASEGVIGGAIETASFLVENYKTIGEVLMTLVTTYGAYKAATMAVVAVQKVHASATAAVALETKLAAMQGIALTASQARTAVATKALSVAMNKLKLVFLSNPWGIAIAAATALGVGIYKLITYETELEKSQRRMNDAISDMESSVASERASIDSLFSTLKNATEGTQQWQYAKDKIIKNYGQYLDGLIDERNNLIDIEQAYKRVTLAAEEAARARALSTASTEAGDAYQNVYNEQTKKIIDQLKKVGNPEIENTLFALIQNDIAQFGALQNETLTSLARELNVTLKSTKFGLVSSGTGDNVDAFKAIRESVTTIRQAKTTLDQEMNGIQQRLGVAENQYASFTTEQLKARQTAIQTAIDEAKAVGDTTDIIVTENGKQVESFKNLAEAQLALSKISSAMKTSQSGIKVDNSLSANVASAKKAAEEAKRAWEQAIKDNLDSKEVETLYKDYEEKTKKYNEALKVSGVDPKANNRAEKEAQARLKQEEKIGQQLLELKQKNADDQLELEGNSLANQREKIGNEYRRRLAEIQALEEEWKKAQNGVLKPDQTSTLSVARAIAKGQFDKGINDILETEQDSWNEYLAEYGSYEEKRLAIAQQYQKKIDEATTQGDKDTLAKQMQSALASLDIEAGKTTSSIGKLFSDLSKKTGKELQEISTNGQKALKFITEEKWNEAKGKELGITKEMYDSIKGDPAKLAELVRKIEDIKKAADDAKGPIETLGDGFEEMFKAGGDSNKFSKGLEKAIGAMGKLNSAAGFVSGALSQMSEAFGGNFLGGIAEGLNVATDAMGSAMEGAQAGAVFGPWGAAAGAAIGMVSSLASSLSKLHDAKHEKRIKEIQEQIERTEKQYDKLGDAADDAFSTTAAGIINEQNQLLERQQRLIRAQIQEEEQKKSADQQRIKDWKEELEEIQDQIKENELAAIDAINGTDIQSAIGDFADAYIEAWQSGTDMADSSLKMVRKMIRTGLTEYLKSTIAPDIETFMKKMSEYLADGVISPWEDDMLQSLAGEAERKANEYFKVTDKYWGDDTEATSGSTTGVESMSQDTADEMNGRMTAIQVAIEAIRANSTTNMLGLQGLTTQIAPMVVSTAESNRALSEIRNLAIQRNDYLADIASYTKLLITISKNISSVKTNTQNI